MGYRIVNGRAYAVGNFEGLQVEQKINSNVNNNSKSFQDILNEVTTEKEEYVLSKHAAERLSDANFTSEDMQNIAKGFNLAEDKGSKNTVMFYKDVALIASVENRTVITAIDKDRTKDNIFTNIDSVVIL